RSGGETMLDAAERRALVRALEIAADPAVPLGPNPRVGCVLLSPSGEVLAEGRHRGAGTAHAEADALARASAPPTGATAVVTLGPLAPLGRTGPRAGPPPGAGIPPVGIARRGPNPGAAGGNARPPEAGVDVELDVPEELGAAAAALNR